MRSVSDLDKRLTDRLAKRNQPETRCLWPAPFNEDTPESAWKFVLQQRSYIETEGRVEAIPALDYLEAYVYLWHECKREGKMLFTQKCRRMMISWVARCLELHQMGLGRCDQKLIGEDYDAASKHVWRLKHLYLDMQKRGWILPPHMELQHQGEKKLRQFSLPNGSICEYGNGDAAQVQGEGCRIITMEEPAQYRYLSEMVAQAKMLTMGPGGQPRGGVLVNLIANTPKMDSPAAYAFNQLKRGWENIEERRYAGNTSSFSRGSEGTRESSEARSA